MSHFSFFKGGHETFLGLINSIVHIIMYTYYLVTIVKPEQKNNIWWKKYLTQLQMVSEKIFTKTHEKKQRMGMMYRIDASLQTYKIISILVTFK